MLIATNLKNGEILWKYTKLKEKFFELVGADKLENISSKYSEYKLKYEDNGEYINADFNWVDQKKYELIIDNLEWEQFNDNQRIRKRSCTSLLKMIIHKGDGY